MYSSHTFYPLDSYFSLDNVIYSLNNCDQVFMSDVSIIQPSSDYITSPILIKSRLTKLMFSKDSPTSKLIKKFRFFCLDLKLPSTLISAIILLSSSKEYFTAEDFRYFFCLFLWQYCDKVISWIFTKKIVNKLFHSNSLHILLMIWY